MGMGSKSVGMGYYSYPMGPGSRVPCGCLRVDVAAMAHDLMADQGKTVHLHDADAPRRGLEPDPVQLVRLHEESVWHKLH